MPADRFRRGGFLAMLALIHLSTASEPYPTQWRVRSSGLVRWDLAEFRLYSDAACRTEIPVLDNIASGRVHGDENPIARQHYFNDKVFDFDVMSYWAGVPDACGNTWVGYVGQSALQSQSRRPARRSWVLIILGTNRRNQATAKPLKVNWVLGVVGVWFRRVL